jgi:hypothetical protein
MFEEEARQRMSAGGGDKRAGKADLPYPLPGTGQAREKVAETVNVSPRSVQAAARVIRDGRNQAEIAKIN